ncbi:MAG: transcriptional regulator MraZ [bacterium]|nr:MAG: transcriptional regulator MraZ [bacterium]
MFFGNYPGTLDDKGRVHIPSIINKLVGDDKTLMIARWRHCLSAFPRESFEAMGQRLAEQSKQKENRAKVHRIVSNFFHGTIKNGKLLIPQELRRVFFELDKKVRIVGMIDHIEIWNQSDWERRDAEAPGVGIKDDLDDLEIL